MSTFAHICVAMNHYWNVCANMSVYIFCMYVPLCAVFICVYVTMLEVHQLFNNTELQKECLDYVSLHTRCEGGQRSMKTITII